MGLYLLRRFFLIIPTLLGITFLSFMITRFVPGGPVEQMILEAKLGNGYSQDSLAGREGLTEEDLQDLKKFYGFDQPFYLSYLKWLGNILSFDLGDSHRYQEPVLNLILERIPISLYYGLVSTLLTYLICIPLGTIKAIKDKTIIDTATSVIIFVGYSVPAFVLGLILIKFLGGELEWFPMQGFTSDEFESFTVIEKVWDIIYHSILPMTCYMIGSFATMTVLMKNSLMEHLGSDYIRTAYAKGVPNKIILFKHAMRNALIPLAASFGNNISLVFTGSYLIETIFNIDGLGLLGFQAVTERDYPVVMGTLFLSSILFLLGNILSDICVATVDPRIRFS